MSTMIDDPKAIELFRLLNIKAAMKLEAVGLKKKGTSATMIAKNLLGLPKGAPRHLVQTMLQTHIEAHESKMGLTPNPNPTKQV